MTYKFCYQLDTLLKEPKFFGYKIYHYSGLEPGKRENAAFLMGAFQVLVLGQTASESWKKFSGLTSFTPFRDAGDGPSSHDCTILNCLEALEKSIKLGWFNMEKFDYEFYEEHGKEENGDMNWIIPGKILGFSCPSNKEIGYSPETYAGLFKELGVSAVVRLNLPEYDSSAFTRQGIRHYDLYFDDGSCPNNDLIERFYKIIETEYGAVAVHCKAGLGRTGTIVATYAIRKYRYPATAFIAWCRICRPGSIVGRQQNFLLDFERLKPHYSPHIRSLNSLSFEFSNENVINHYQTSDKNTKRFSETPSHGLHSSNRSHFFMDRPAFLYRC